MDRQVDANNIGRIFKSANLNLDNPGVNTTNALIRYEFIEALVRIAKEKYCKAGDRNDSTADAFEKLMKDNVIPMS